MCVGTCVMSLIAAAVVKLTCPDIRDGHQDECGNVDALGFPASFIAGIAVGIGGEFAMVEA